VSVVAGTSVFIHAGFWSAERCARVRHAIDGGEQSSAEVYEDGFRVDETVRRTLEVDVDPIVVRDVTESIAEVRPSVSRFFAMPLVASEGPGFLRYPPGGFYLPHRDCLPGAHDQFPRRIAIVLFLNDAEGGMLRLYAEGDSAIDIAPAAGTLVAFPATWLHEVLPVTAGVRDAIVDWFY
jgi:predicted 2-oxoglutarate/Fe(II)-dependent dioxygenase YbiX